MIARLAFVLACGSVLASCAPPPIPYSCQSTSNCGSAGAVETCCTATQCEYRVLGSDQVFPCLGTDCTGARAAVAAYCGPLCPDAWVDDDAWVPDDASIDANVEAGAALDAQPCVR